MPIEKPMPQKYPLTASLWQELISFDQYGSGDRDGKLEYTDIDPYSLELKFRRFAPFWKKSLSENGIPRFELDASKSPRLRQGLAKEAAETTLLWNNFVTIQHRLLEKLKSGQKEVVDFEKDVEALSQNPERVTRADILKTFTFVFEQAPYNMDELQENFTGEIGAVMGDSLSTSMQFATQSTPATPETPPYLLPQLVLQSIGFSANELSILTLDKDFPFSGYKLLEPDGSFVRATLSQVSNIFLSNFGAVESLDCALENPGYEKPVAAKKRFCLEPKDPKVYMAAIPAATLRDILNDLEKPGDWKSPAQIFLNLHRPRLLKETQKAEEKNLLGYVLTKTAEMRQKQKSKGGFLTVALGSNDLLTFRQIVVSAAEINAGEYERDLEILDQQTQSLVKDGVRRIFFIPPNVADAFEELPSDAKYTDGEKIPPGSAALYHWVVAAREDQRLPRHVVLSAQKLQSLKDEYINYREAIEKILVERSNWLVMDNRWDLPGIFKKIGVEGITVHDIPGYGDIFYAGREVILSPDNEHPSNFGYLVWSELINQAARNHNIQQTNKVQPLSYLPVEETQAAVLESIEDVRQRVEKRIQANPSVYRPRRLPYDEIKTLDLFFEKLKTERDQKRILASLQKFWPFLSHTALDQMLALLGKTPESAAHHVKAGLIKNRLESIPPSDFEKSWPDLAEIFCDWAKNTKKNWFDQIHFAQAYFSAVGAREEYGAHNFKQGNVPGILDTRRLFQTAAAGYHLDANKKASSASIEYNLGLTTNTAYLLGDFSYFSFLAGPRLTLPGTDSNRWNLDGALKMFANTPLRTPRYLQWEAGGMLVFPKLNQKPKESFKNLSLDYEFALSYWPFNDPAFEKAGWGARVAVRDFIQPSRWNITASLTRSF